MVPVIPVVIIILLLLRRGKGGGASRWVLVLVLKSVLAMIGMAIAEVVPWWLAAPIYVGLTVIWLPTLVLEWVVLPLGWWRVAYWLVRLSRPYGMEREMAAAGVWFAARALAHSGNVGPLPELRRKLEQLPSLDKVGRLAGATLAALAGNRELARCLFLSADCQVGEATTSVRAYARDWLLVDAARAGNVREIRRLTQRPHDQLRWSSFIAALDARRRGQPISQLRLYTLWLKAPRRRLGWSLLRHLRPLPQPPRPHPAATLADAWAGLAYCLANHQAISATRFVHSLHWLDRMLRSEAVVAHIAQRTLVLSTQLSPEQILARVGQQVVDLIEPIIAASPQLVIGKTRRALIAPAVTRVRQRLLREITDSCEDYVRRQDQAGIGALLEWEIWVQLQDRAHRLLALDPASAELVFDTMFRPVCNFAVHQINDVHNAALAYDMFSWLYPYSFCHPEARSLLEQNKAASGSIANRG